MIGRALKYSYINAKVRAIKSRLLTPDDYHILISTKNFGEFLTYLQTTTYGEGMPETSTPKELIGRLYGHLFAAYKKILRGLHEKDKEVIKTLLLRYEIENLKVILRGIEFKISEEKQSLVLYPLGTLSALPINELLVAKDIRSAVSLLKETRYHYPLTHALHQYESQKSLFPLEMSLDLFVFKEMRKAIHHLGGEDKKVCSKMVGIWIDILNILWIGRLREYYHLSAEEILNYAIEGGYYLSLRQIKGLARAKDLQDLIETSPLPYAKILKGVKNLQETRKRLNSFFINQLLKVFYKPFHLGIPLGYILLKEIEIQNLTAIIEGKELGLSYESIRYYLSMD